MKIFCGSTQRAFSATLLLAAAGPALAQAPVITSVIPMANARAVARTSPVTVNFSQPLTAASAGALKVFSSQRGGLRTRGATPAVVNGNALSFAPTAYPYMPGETVQYTVVPTTAPGGGAPGRVGQFTAAVGGTGRGDFILPSTPPNQNIGSPKSIAIGDLDGDGDLDLLTTHYSYQIGVLMNDGAGMFNRTSLIAVGNDISGIAIGDLDGDGDLDFVTANRTDGTASVRLNNGAGAFTAPSSRPEVAVGNSPRSVVLSDVDYDGDLDLLCANASSNSVSVRINNGASVFAPLATNSEITVGNSPYGLTVGDVDGDGDMDVLTANRDGGTVSVRLNDGNGYFTSPSSNPNPVVSYSPSLVVVGDIDGDGDLDLLSASGNSYIVSVRVNDGLGNFTSPSTIPDLLQIGATVSSGLAMGDVDGDGDLDLLVVQENAGFPFQYGIVGVRLNSGQGNFLVPASNPNPAMGSLPSGIAVGDADGDGDVDMMVTNGSSNTVSVRLNGGTGPLASAAGRLVTSSLASFPNPAHSAVTISGAIPNAPLTVLDALGRALLTATTDAAGTARLPLDGLSAGVYLVRSGEQVRRLTVE